VPPRVVGAAAAASRYRKLELASLRAHFDQNFKIDPEPRRL